MTNWYASAFLSWSAKNPGRATVECAAWSTRTAAIDTAKAVPTSTAPRRRIQMITSPWWGREWTRATRPVAAAAVIEPPVAAAGERR